jgi:hypothetical protein
MNTRELLIEFCARTAHEVNRAYCRAHGDGSQEPWEVAPDWQRSSARQGVRLILDGAVTAPEQLHESWLRTKAAEGWQYGPFKDVEKKVHPCFLPFAELPAFQRAKDHIFFAVVKAAGAPMLVAATELDAGQPPRLDARPARTDLTSRECVKLLGSLIGGLCEMADAATVRDAVRWLAMKDAFWQQLGAPGKPAV